VADDPCGAETRVEDLGARTLLVSPERARLLEPGQPLAQAADVGAGLPTGRGSAVVFATDPLMLRMEARPRRYGMEKSVPHRLFRLAGAHWVEDRTDFGEIPVALPIDGGVVVVGWFDDRARGDPAGVPAGNQTRAFRIASDGSVSPVRAWPNVMSWQERSTRHTVWAVVAKPARPGQFLMRLPVDGPARLFPIPGVGRCGGDDRLEYLADLGAVTDDGARVVVHGYGCVPESADGQYTLRAADGHWVREGPAPALDTPRGGGDVVVGDRRFAIEGSEVLVTEHGGTRRFPLANLGPPSPTASDTRTLFTTAGGREVWVEARHDGRCRVFRY
jgi:hypothetical protein